MEKFDIEIPNELLKYNSHQRVNLELIKNKKIIGLVGYAGSGKDTIGSKIVDLCGYKRISFGDTLKRQMDIHLRQKIYDDLIKRGTQINFDDINFINPKDRVIKEILRPYMIWFGEFIKQNNGMQFWVNKTLEEVVDFDKIIITDVRRENELELFYNSKGLKKRLKEDLNGMNLNNHYKENETLLIYISQFNLKDNDTLTHSTIRTATEEWLFDFYININPLIPLEYRDENIKNKVSIIVNNFPDFFI